MMDDVKNVNDVAGNVSKVIDIDKLTAAIDEKIAQLEKSRGIELEERTKIIELIKTALTRHKIHYVCDSKDFSIVNIFTEKDNQPFHIYIFLLLDSVLIKAVFPIRVLCGSMALVSMFLARRSNGLGSLVLEHESGEISVEYQYYIKSSKDFNEELFIRYLDKIADKMRLEYRSLSYLVVGKALNKEKEFYRKLLKLSVDMIDEKENDISIYYYSYGTETLRKNILETNGVPKDTDYSKLESEDDDDNDDDQDSDDFSDLFSDDDDDNEPDDLPFSSSMRIPTFSEFLRSRNERLFADSKKEKKENTGYHKSFIPFKDEDEENADNAEDLAESENTDDTKNIAEPENADNTDDTDDTKES